MADCSGIMEENQLREQHPTILDILNEDIGPFPEYMLNLMKFLGYDNFLSIKDFNTDDIDEIEEFAQNKLMHLLEPKSKEKIRQFYGVYSVDPKRFTFLPGHRKLLLNINEYVGEKGRDYFTRRTSIKDRRQYNNKRKHCDDHVENHERRSQRNAVAPVTLNPLNDAEDYQNIFEQQTQQQLQTQQQQQQQPQIQPDDADLDYYDGTDTSTDGGVTEFKKPCLLTASEQQSHHDFDPNEHELHIRSLVNKWMYASTSKFIKGTVIDSIEDYSVIFHHRPDEGKLTASLQCCICRNNIGVSSQLRKSGTFRWLISNYMRHVKKLHFEKDECDGGGGGGGGPSSLSASSSGMSPLYASGAIKLELDEEQIKNYD